MNNKNISYLLDRDSNTPLYKQVEQIIKQLLDTAPYNSGEYLPGENELIEQLGVARHTVRHALKELTDKGLIIRERGKGTKKTHKDNKIHTNIKAWSSFTDEMNAQGQSSKLQSIQTGVKEAPIEVQEFFNAKTELAFLLREYGFSTSSQVDIIFESYFDPALNLDTDIDFSEHKFIKLYDFLKIKRGIIATSSKEKIEVINHSNLKDISLDKAIISSNIIKRTRMVFDQNGNCFEYNLGYYNAELFIFHFESTIN